LDRRRWARPGVYCLLGEAATPWPLYIGSSGDLLSRVMSHLSNRIHWQRVVLACYPGMDKGEAEQVEGQLVRQLRPFSEKEEPIIDLETERAPTPIPDDLPKASDLRALMLGLELVLQFGGLNVSLEVSA
jgi:hypothetical protein